MVFQMMMVPSAMHTPAPEHADILRCEHLPSVLLPRKKALQRENEIIAEAKEEAGRIIASARQEAELEKKRVRDEVKQEMISVASLISEKFVAASLSPEQQNALIEQTLEEMGDETWLN